MELTCMHSIGFAVEMPDFALKWFCHFCRQISFEIHPNSEYCRYLWNALGDRFVDRISTIHKNSPNHSVKAKTISI